MQLATTLTIAGLVVAILALALTYWAYRRGGGARSRIVVSLTELAAFDPERLGLHVSMKIGRLTIGNLYLLEISVANKGPHDVVLPDADAVTAHSQRPRIKLPTGFKAVADPWNPDGIGPAADVRVARSLSDDGHQLLHIHIHRLRRRETVRSHVLCTRDDASPDETRLGEVTLLPGFIPNTSVAGAGLLKAEVPSQPD